MAGQSPGTCLAILVVKEPRPLHNSFSYLNQANGNVRGVTYLTRKGPTIRLMARAGLPRKTLLAQTAARANGSAQSDAQTMLVASLLERGVTLLTLLIKRERSFEGWEGGKKELGKQSKDMRLRTHNRRQTGKDERTQKK